MDLEPDLEIDPWTIEFWRKCFLPMLRVRVNEKLGTPCMEWMGVRNEHGHGVLLLSDYASLYTHRYAIAMFMQADPGAWWVLHRCDNAPCCNPMHLYLGTPSQNNIDRYSRGSIRGTLEKARAPFRENYIRNRCPDVASPKLNIWTAPIG